MGLNITAYGALRKEMQENAGLNTVVLSDPSEGARRSEGIEVGVEYSYSVDYSFKADSYSEYFEFREMLSRLADYSFIETLKSKKSVDLDDLESRPFGKLIFFSDIEGTIGPAVSDALSSDFENFQGMADLVGHEGFKRTYAHFRKAFDLAKDGGAVVFS